MIYQVKEVVMMRMISTNKCLRSSSVSPSYFLFRPLPTINLNKRQKNPFTLNTDPMFDSIADSVVVLPDNWHTLNSRKSTTQTNITKSKKQQQEKGSNYNDRMKSKVTAKKIKNQKKSKQKHL
jgi:hypothetical protein